MRQSDSDTKKSLTDRLSHIVSSFLSRHSGFSVSLLGEGNINDTYLVEFSDRAPAVLQRINPNVFPEPVRVADNVQLVTEYIRHRKPAPGSDRRTLRLIPTRSGASCFIDDQGQVWRMVEYLANTECYSSVRSGSQAFEGGAMLGWFHRQLDDLNPDRVLSPLPGFHDLPGYFRQFQQVMSGHTRRLTTDVKQCCREADKRCGDAALLQSALRSGKTRPRVIHGDPKIDNILFDKDSGRAVALIDLDICRLMLEGYCSSGACFPPSERNLVYQGVRLLTYELALRFLSDYLNNNQYFKVSDEEENLRRAVVQFTLLSSIERQQELIEKIALQV